MFTTVRMKWEKRTLFLLQSWGFRFKKLKLEAASGGSLLLFHWIWLDFSDPILSPSEQKSVMPPGSKSKITLFPLLLLFALAEKGHLWYLLIKSNGYWQMTKKWRIILVVVVLHILSIGVIVSLLIYSRNVDVQS